MIRKTVLVWIFICLAVLALISVIFWKLSLPRKTGYYELWGIFEDVAGLKVGDAIRFRGKPIGFIDKLTIEPNGVRVRLLIDNNIRVPYGSRLQIVSEGLMGTRFLEILPPDQPTDSVLVPGSFLPVKKLMTMADIQEAAFKLIGKIDALVDSLSKRINAINPNEIKTIVSETRTAVHQLRSVESGIVATTDSLQKLSSRISVIADGLEKLTTDSTFTNDLKTTARNLRDVSAALLLLKKLCFWSR
jgi:phospholipid/cholesterol/gamma-HCH transport system substrate-binding protein